MQYHNMYSSGTGFIKWTFAAASLSLLIFTEQVNMYNYITGRLKASPAGLA